MCRSLVPPCLRVLSPDAHLSQVQFVGVVAQLMASEESLDSSFRTALLEKWASPGVVGALREHGTLDGDKFVSDVGAATAALERGRSPCALPSCGAREAAARAFRVCSGCEKVAYCCAEHAAAHWKDGHKRECKELRAGGAKKEAGPGGVAPDVAPGALLPAS